MATQRAAGVLGYAALFTSFSTLLCCALPLLLVTLGLGATVVSIVSAAPWLITLSRHKNWTFAIAGLLIAANFVYVFRIAPRLQAQACATGESAACAGAGRGSRFILWLSTGFYAIGLFSAYLLGPILRMAG